MDVITYACWIKVDPYQWNDALYVQAVKPSIE